MSKKVIYILIVIIVLAVIGIWFWTQAPVTQAPVSGTPQGNDNTAAITSDLNSISIEDPDFKSIDSDLDSL